MSKRRASTKDVNGLLQQGYQLHQQGQRDLAASFYRDALRMQPRNFDALHLLGMLSLEINETHAAIGYLEEAVAVNPGDPDARSTLGVALQMAGRANEALSSLDHAIRLSPTTAEFHYNRGKLLRELGRLDDSLASYDTAVRCNPGYVDAWNNRSDLLLVMNQFEAALNSADRALEIAPEYPGALINRGIALLALQRTDQALESFTRSLELKPQSPVALHNRGNALMALDRFNDALADYEKAVSTSPGWIEPLTGKAGALLALQRPEEALVCVDQILSVQPHASSALHLRGAALNDLKRPGEAIKCLEQVLAVNPGHAGALIDRGNALMSLNRFSDARASYEQAVHAAPDNPAAHWGLCLCLLLIGEFEKGWAEYGWRWLTHLKNVRPSFEKPRWKGTRVDGTLLVWGEQGLGDQVIYASMLDEAAKLADQIVVAAAPRMLPLFERSFPAIRFVTMDMALTENIYDAQAPMGDLGGHLRHNAEDFLRHRTAYLKADAARSAALRHELARDTSRICGLSWISSNNAVGSEKSMALRDLLPLLSTPECRFVDLQYGDTAAERDALRQETGIEVTRVASVDTWNDIDGLAALVDACDVIVTISNTTAHIAGALGKEVYLMLPYSQGRFWYWQTDRGDTLWYPNVRVFRQPSAGDWATVIAQVSNALATRAANPG